MKRKHTDISNFFEKKNASTGPGEIQTGEIEEEQEPDVNLTEVEPGSELEKVSSHRAGTEHDAVPATVPGPAGKVT